MPTPSCDVLVLGAGVNGLACAQRLQQAGLSVLVLEAADEPGGGAREVGFHPGFRAPALAHATMGLDPRLARLVPVAFHPPLVTIANGLRVAAGQAEGPDAAAWATLQARLTRFAQVLAPLRRMAAPNPGGGNDRLALLRRGLALKLLGREDLRELMRLILINVHDVAEDELTDDRLRGLLAFDATLGAWVGPRSPNTLILYLDRLARGPSPLVPVGGMGALVATLAGGLSVRCKARVARVLIDGERATGVELDTGEQIHARRVVSALNPRLTLQSLVGPRHLDAGLFRRLGHIRMRGGAARLLLALRGLPVLDHPGARHVLAPSSRAVDATFDAAKYGGVPDRPVLEFTLPSVLDPALAPQGAHVLSATVQFAPHSPRDPDAARAQMLEATLKVLEDHIPGLKAEILRADMLMPGDIQARFGLPDWHHGNLAVEQMLFNRPLHGLHRNATPIEGLFLAGAGSHPGGGIEGAAGWNAAEAVLEARP